LGTIGCDAIKDQVDEIVIALDDCPVPTGLGNVVVVPGKMERTGYGKTCMRGVHVSSGEHLLMLNDDCWMNAGSVQKMTEAMQPGVGIVGSELWFSDGTLQHGGMRGGPGHVGYGHVNFRQKTPAITERTELECVTFASALVRREAFFAVRGFDEDYDCYSEDTDLCLRIRKAGWSIMYEPAAKGIHDESQTTSPMKGQLAVASSKIFRKKWSSYFLQEPVGTFK
jgi:GT2 family glycosyltransferase